MSLTSPANKKCPKTTHIYNPLSNQAPKIRHFIPLYWTPNFRSLTPDSFSDIFGQVNQRSSCIKTEKVRYKCLEIFPKAFLPKIWNFIPMNLKYSTSLKELQRCAKSNFINVYDSFTCRKINCHSCKKQAQLDQGSNHSAKQII